MAGRMKLWSPMYGLSFVLGFCLFFFFLFVLVLVFRFRVGFLSRFGFRFSYAFTSGILFLFCFCFNVFSAWVSTSFLLFFGFFSTSTE